MPELAKHSIYVRFEGGVADEHIIPLYDGTASVHGVAKALQIATHAYLSGQIVSRATAMRGATMYMKPTRKGSFLVEFITLIEAHPVTSAAAVAISAKVYNDFIKFAFSRATGDLLAEPDTKHLKKIYDRIDPPPLEKPVDIDELAEQLEGSLQNAHRPIGEDGGIIQISIEQPREKLIVFDKNTKDWVNTREEEDTIEIVQGNITRFNSLSRNGRVFIKQLNKVVPFKPAGDFPLDKLPLITWSLHGSNTALPKKLELKIRKVFSSHGETKRVLLADCTRLE